jgi:hypothetical protein
VELAGDRRKTRYSRLRKAVENGLVNADALKVRRQPKTEAALISSAVEETLSKN